MLFVAGKNKIAYIYAGRCMDTLKRYTEGSDNGCLREGLLGEGQGEGKKGNLIFTA